MMKQRKIVTEHRVLIRKILRRYSSDTRRIGQLQYELEHLSPISENELISSLALHSPGEGQINRQISDKTMRIALEYQCTMEKMNTETVTDIRQELRILRVETGRLEHYVSLLGNPKTRIITAHYFMHISIVDLAKEFDVSKSTISRSHNNALDELWTMYSFLDSIKESAN